MANFSSISVETLILSVIVTGLLWVCTIHVLFPQQPFTFYSTITSLSKRYFEGLRQWLQVYWVGFFIFLQSQKLNKKLDQKNPITLLTNTKFDYYYITSNHRGLLKTGESGNARVRMKHCYSCIYKHWSNL